MLIQGQNRLNHNIELPFSVLEILRYKHKQLHNYMFQYETYIEEDAAPFWDFRYFRSKRQQKNYKGKQRIFINQIITLEIFIQWVNRCKNILDNLSNKPDFKGFRRKLVTKTF